MGPIRSEQMCSRCRNHGKNSILKGHKQLCPFLLCACKKCNDTKMRQKCIASEIAIHRRHLKLTNNSESLNLVPKFRSEKFESKYSIESVEHRRSQMCARCKNHGIDQPLRGHKNECKFADCQCEICEITAERRKIMAKQIREYRQTKLADGPDSTKEPNFDEVSLSSNESLRITPVNSQVYKPIPHFFDKFYMVQTLYDKFLQENTIKQIQLLYALVNLANDDCNVLEKALQEALPYATEYAVHHQNFLSRSFLDRFLPPSPPSSTENITTSSNVLRSNVWVRDMRDLIENGMNVTHSN